MKFKVGEYVKVLEEPTDDPDPSRIQVIKSISLNDKYPYWTENPEWEVYGESAYAENEIKRLTKAEKRTVEVLLSPLSKALR